MDSHKEKVENPFVDFFSFKFLGCAQIFVKFVGFFGAILSESYGCLEGW